MQDQLTQEMYDLRNALFNLPAQWETEKRELLRLKMVEAAAEVEVQKAESAMVMANGGMKGLGSNDTERKEALNILKRTDTDYTRAAKMATTARIDREAHEVTVERLEKQFQAVGYQSRLLAGLFNYLGSAGIPVLLPEEVELHGYGI